MKAVVGNLDNKSRSVSIFRGAQTLLIRRSEHTLKQRFGGVVSTCSVTATISGLTPINPSPSERSHHVDNSLSSIFVIHAYVNGRYVSGFSATASICLGPSLILRTSCVPYTQTCPVQIQTQVYLLRYAPNRENSVFDSFELEVLAPLDRTVISNTPVMMSNEETVTLASGRKERRRRWRFGETPVMSTYLLALVCCCAAGIKDVCFLFEKCT